MSDAFKKIDYETATDEEAKLSDEMFERVTDMSNMMICQKQIWEGQNPIEFALALVCTAVHALKTCQAVNPDIDPISMAELVEVAEEYMPHTERVPEDEEKAMQEMYGNKRVLN